MAKNEQLKLAVEQIKVSHKLNQVQIAEKLGINPTYLSGIINGKYPLTAKLASEISELFNIDSLINSEDMQADCEEEFKFDRDDLVNSGGEAFAIKMNELFKKGEIYSSDSYKLQSQEYLAIVRAKDEKIEELNQKIGRLEAIVEIMKGKKPEDLL